jgi:predicted enzyme related to lactoylglutathione lyase
MTHLSNWVEIPARDLGRAAAFYARLLGEELQPMELGGNRYALFPSKDRFNCGALAQGDGYEPGTQGLLVYLDGGPDLDAKLARVAEAGGTVLLPKTYLGPEAGSIALFLDTEGNKIGLQTMD